MEEGTAAVEGRGPAVKQVTAAPFLWCNQIAEPQVMAGVSEGERCHHAPGGGGCQGRVPGAGARERARWQRGAGRPVFSHPANVGLLPTFFLNVVIIRYKALFGFLFISLE